MAEQFVRQIGYTEMFEWQTIPESAYGLFVQFNKDEPEKVEPYHDKDGVLVGVSTVSARCISDDPEQWDKAYLYNELGDNYLKKERLAVGIKQYDQHNEFSYISTRPWEHYVNVINPKYDKNRNYVKRSLRNEWVKVNIGGKVIVKDNGKCKPGEFCQPYTGMKAKLAGTAQPYEEGKYKFYVINRISENTITILNNNYG